jgi:hypothetical protein
MSSYIPICVALVASAVQGPHFSWFLNLVCRHPAGHFCWELVCCEVSTYTVEHKH